MKKFSLFILALLCLCSNAIWAEIAWTNDYSGTGSSLPSDNTPFYLYSVKTGKFLRAGTGVVEYQEASPWYLTTISWNYDRYIRSNVNNTEYYLSIGTSSVNVTLTSPEDNDKKLALRYNSDGYYMIRRVEKSWGNVYWCVNQTWKTLENKSNDSSDANSLSQWYFVSPTQYNNHIALDKYYSLVEACSSLDGYSSLTITDYSDYASWLSTVDKSSAINTDISTLETFRASALASAIAGAADGSVTDITFMIDNPSFEVHAGSTCGWILATVSGDNYPSDFGAKAIANNTYAVTNGEGDYLYNTWSNSDYGGDGLYQTITGLPNGRYRVSAWLTANNSYAPCLRVNDTYISAGAQTNLNLMTQVTYDVTVTNGEITIGARGQQDGNKYRWFKVDNFQLAYLTAPYSIAVADANDYNNWSSVGDANSSRGWTNPQSVTYDDIGMVECYNKSNLAAKMGDIIAYQFINLENGYYTANVDFNVHCANHECSIIRTAGDEMVGALKVNNQYATTGLVNNTSSVTKHTVTVSGIYVSDGTITFTVSTLAPGANWLSVHLNSLTYNGPAESISLHVSNVGWASFCAPFDVYLPTTDGFTAYYAKEIKTIDDAEAITLEPITASSIAAGEPIIVNASEGDYVFTVSDENPSSIENLLGGTTSLTYFTSEDKYVLKGVNAGVPYFAMLKTQYEDGNAYLPAYKAYIDASVISAGSSAPERISLVIEDTNNATSIATTNGDIKAQKVLRDGQILILRGNEAYDLMGRRLK